MPWGMMMSEEQHAATEAPRSRWGFCCGCAIGAALLVVAMIAVAVGVRRAPEKFPGAVRAIFGAEGEAGRETPGGGISPELLQAARGVKPAVEITLKESDLKSYLEKHPEAIGLPGGFEAPQVGFRDGLVVASARTRVVVAVRVWISMRPAVEDGRVQLSVTEVDAGGISLPGEFRKQVQREVERLINQRVQEAGFQPDSVEVKEGTLTIRGRLTVPEER